MRLCTVVRCLDELLTGDREPGDPVVDDEIVDAVESAISLILSAADEMGECASALEAAANHQVPVRDGEELRWASGPQEHYPELLGIDVPRRQTEDDRSARQAFDRVLTQVRLQTTAVRDRYTVVLPGLPWIGCDRDEFAGPRLTAVRAALESAVESLRWAAADREVDLTDAAVELSIES